MKRGKTFCLIIGVGLALLLFWYNAPAIGAPDTIKVGSSCSLTGVFGAGGAQCKAGYEIAIQHINEAGGVYVKEYGKKIPLELILFDDESNMTTTVSRLETLNAEHKVVAYLGGFSSPIHATQAPIAEKNRIPLLMVASYFWGVHQRGYKYNFSPFPKSPDCAKAIFELLSSLPKDQQPTKVAMFLEKAPVGMELGVLWKSEAEAHGFEIVFSREHARGTKDYSPFILGAKASGAETLLTGPTTPEGILITKQLKELHYNPKFYFAYRAPDPVAWGKALGKDGDYIVLGPGWNSGLKYPNVDKLNKTHMEKYGRVADVMVGPAYSCVQIVANAIEKAGTLDRADIRDAIAATDLMTVIGPVKFRPDGTGIVTYFCVQWLNGKQECIAPKEMATAPFVYPAPAWKDR